MKTTGTVKDVLREKRPGVLTIGPDDTVYEAIRRMAKENVGALVVVSDGHLVGILSERDYTRKIALAGRASRETRVRDILAHRPVTVGLRDDIATCMRLMTTHRVRHLPVLDGEQLAGVVSIGDLVNFVISVQDATIEQLENYITGVYPA